MRKITSEGVPLKQDCETPTASRSDSSAQESLYAEIVVNLSRSLVVSPLATKISPLKPALVPRVSSVPSCMKSQSKYREPNMKDTRLASLSRRNSEFVLEKAKVIASNNKPTAENTLRPRQNIFLQGMTGVSASRAPMHPVVSSSRLKTINKHSSTPELGLKGRTSTARAMSARRLILANDTKRNARWDDVESKALEHSIDLSNVFVTEAPTAPHQIIMSSSHHSASSSQSRCNSTKHSSLDLRKVFGESLNQLDRTRKRTNSTASMRSLGDSTDIIIDQRASLAPTCPVRLPSPLKKFNKHSSTPELGWRGRASTVRSVNSRRTLLTENNEK